MRISELALLKEPVTNPRELISEYRFELKGISITIAIKVYRDLSNGDITYTQSHFIRTPLQEKVTRPAQAVYPTVIMAVEDAINGLAEAHKEAVERQMTPDPSWLVTNEAF